ncbi:uncharacterized protein LOC126716461 [Quercus robur]|uniref:uncharacterized protein LOC126716461 n=1 Tax=Quercus robur TaxID=38942 RepID=UPI00216339B9|nr:uncharacterized protein LOC126716461 [Quercus robur]
MTRPPIPPLSPPSQIPGSCSYCQLTNLVFPAQTNSSGVLDSVSKMALAALFIYKSISVIRKWFSRPVHTRSGDPAHSGTRRILDTKITGVELANLNGSNQNDSAEGCSILDTKITAGLESTNQNDSAEGCSILDTKITAGEELTDQNDSAEDSSSEILV